MDMDAMLEELSAGSNDHHTMIMKGKRTKRQRPLSPAGRATSSSSSGGGGEKSGCSDLYINSSSEISTSTEEDEDMANCLILLAQGGVCSIIKQEEEEMKTGKFSRRRRFMNHETVTTTTTTAVAKAGFYVYECKTCNRTFPSFQALGGHRASHKKPKPMLELEKKVNDQGGEEGEDIGREFIRPSNDASAPSMEIISSNKASHGNNNNIIKSSKIHECSICGSEFSSGQALGGHMRRHRNNPTTTKASEKPSSSSSSIFPLDLNLPAPEDLDHRDLKLQYAANQQHLVFSAPALVDCHY